MKKLTQLFWLIFLLLPSIVRAEVKEIPFTLDDRDRIIRTEQKIELLESKIEGLDIKIDSKVDGVRVEMNARFEAMDKRFDQLFNFLWAIIGIFTTMMISVFGFAFWDRKLSLAPLKNQDQKILAVLTDYAKTQPKLLEIMRNAGLL